MEKLVQEVATYLNQNPELSGSLAGAATMVGVALGLRVIRGRRSPAPPKDVDVSVKAPPGQSVEVRINK